MSIAVVPALIEDRAVFTRERANGYYHVAAHVIADSVVTIPGLLLISLLCTIIIYFMVGLSHGGEGFAVFLFCLFMSLYELSSALVVPTAFGLMDHCLGWFWLYRLFPPRKVESMLALISAIVPHYVIGMALGSGVYGMFMLSEGFFVITCNIPVDVRTTLVCCHSSFLPSYV
eukprot:m.758522 g.758522  ORF g.758522 m.758522 type:complete len:173 (+) comp59036_c1_seq26:623-1141(+)